MDTLTQHSHEDDDEHDHSLALVDTLVQAAGPMTPQRSSALRKWLALLLDPHGALAPAMLQSTQAADADKAAGAMVSLALAAGNAHLLLHRTIRAEIARTTDPNTLFRGSSMASKMMSHYARRIGTDYLLTTLRKSIESIVASPQSCEVSCDRLASADRGRWILSA